jgi:hypothetical protein
LGEVALFLLRPPLSGKETDMGYTTEFEGEVKFNKPLTVAQFKYLEAFAEVRHVKRDTKITEQLEDKRRHAVGLQLGIEGAYFVGGEDDEGVIDGNKPPVGQPDLYCQWVPTDDGQGLQWDGNEKFYGYVEWMQYLIKHFLAPWGIVANGEIKWHGEERKDFGVLEVKDNVVTAHKGVLELKKEEEEEDDGDTAPTYSRQEVIEALESIVASAQSALKNIKKGKGDPEGDLNDLHATINDLFWSVDEGKADYQ